MPALKCKKGHRYEYTVPDKNATSMQRWSAPDERPPAADILGLSAGRLCPKCIVAHLREHFGLEEEK